VGAPDAITEKVAGCPTVTVRPAGCVVIDGAAPGGSVDAF
jgi:hypothetical protein